MVSTQKTRKVAVLMGGRNSEHEVSLSTGAMMVEGLDPAQYRVKPIKIDLDGAWCVPPGFPGAELLSPLRRDGRAWRTYPGQALARLEEAGVDVVLLALHGPNGEDGTIQGMLEIAGIPYTGAGVTGSALAMDKRLSKELMAAGGIDTPEYAVIEPADWDADAEAVVAGLVAQLGVPVVVKRPRQGSSTGMGIAPDAEQLTRLIDQLIEGEPLLAEAHISGRELTCAVLARPGGGLEALPATEIRPRAGRFFDYRAKYQPGASEELTPAPLEPAQRAAVEATALAVHRRLRCGPLSRTDMILTAEGRLTVLETNTLPGMTPTSLVPQAAAAAGIPFGRLLDRLITLALERRPPAVGGPRCAGALRSLAARSAAVSG